MNVRTCKNWCAAWSTSGAGALATAPVPHDDDQGSQVVRVNVVAVSQSQGRGGEFSLQLFFFCFRTQILARADRHGEEAQEAPHACRGGESGERALQLARRASGTLHNACTPFHAPALHPRPPESIAGAVLAEHTGAVRMPKDAWLGPSNSDSL